MSLKECEVCGDEKDVSRHYGVACCYGCKAFFRRTVFEKKKYGCKEEGACQVTKANRNRCRFCRYQKCLQAGMSEENCREPYCATTKSISSSTIVVKSRPKSPPSEDNNNCLPCPPRIMSPESSGLITFLKAMTRSTVQNIDPTYENLTFKECFKLPINRKISLGEALQNPHLVMPKLKTSFLFSPEAEMAFGWYQAFVYVAEWARGIPQFRMLQIGDQEKLFKLNFARISFPLFAYFVVDNYDEFKKQLASPQEYSSTFSATEHIGKKELGQMVKEVYDMYEVHIINLFLQVLPDEEEMALGMAIMLFQFTESLTNEGHLICSKYKEKLYTALYEYQMIKFGDKTELERIQRYTLLMELMHRVTKIWSEECEFHLILSTFNGMNIDGLIKDLLFTKCLNK